MNNYLKDVNFLNRIHRIQYKNGYYEGEIKDNIKNGKGRQRSSSFLKVYLFYSFSIGKFFFSNGDRYEGEYKDDKMNGQGKKQVIYCMIYRF